jgi:hypothetical protein
MELTTSMIKLAQKELKKKGKYHGEIDGRINAGVKSALGTIPQLKPHWRYKQKLIGFIQLLCIENNIDTGDLDGLWGTRTAYAYEVLKQYLETGVMPGNWRDIEPLDVNPHHWPKETESDLIAFYGEPGEQHLTVFQAPYPLKASWDKRIIIQRVRCHEKVKESLETILNNVLDHYGHDKINELHLNVYGGSYSYRKKRGGSSWSTHAWGIAMDFDPDNNQLRWGRDKALFAQPEYDAWWRFWEEEGWTSLGRVKNYDWMHVQAAKIH